MVEAHNSFYGNRHTSRTPLAESLKDIYRRHQLKHVYGVSFYTPEVRGLNYDDRDHPEAGGFQVVVRLAQFPTYNPRWSVSIQHKAYEIPADIADKNAKAILLSETLVAPDLTTLQAFSVAMKAYSHIRWDEAGTRKGYVYNERVHDDVQPLRQESDQQHPMMSILSMPAYETLRQGTHRLEERRTIALNKLREGRLGNSLHQQS